MLGEQKRQNNNENDNISNNNNISVNINSRRRKVCIIRPEQALRRERQVIIIPKNEPPKKEWFKV